jgi:hypothetical protein
MGRHGEKKSELVYLILFRVFRQSKFVVKRKTPRLCKVWLKREGRVQGGNITLIMGLETQESSEIHKNTADQKI